ncbi:DUF2169 family type VI secretion system accessory protein [Caballeronia ptereochthonis]|uniref:DUF2169 domain-containing protein n=1 Tax=Caballeronia ptereochthonis TaxID=1777144 RepID=A0A157ZZ95_9BURK|nr:DUF2169 domain-containing protein [Caballeronia ptereochthonis]SAK50799.1 hypothetical protein AWB83_01175 [Caballeronia ptereochthonis]
MNILNYSRMQAAVTTAADRTARDHLLVVVKGTFLIPDDGGAAVLAPANEQAPLAMADTFTGLAGASSPVLEAEFALRKPRCDVLVTATVHAPQGKPTRRCRAGVRLGNWQKEFDVVGDRTWVLRGPSLVPSTPAGFLTMPLTYDRAFGGSDASDPDTPVAYRANPVGCGYGLRCSAARLIGKPVPNTEDPYHPVCVPWGTYRPMSLGPVHRSWEPRVGYAGTYDQAWLDNTFPFFPADFDDRHYQSAPEDQQIEEPSGGEEVVLLNLGRAGRSGFRLPADLTLPVVFFPRGGEPQKERAILDTVLIAPDVRRLYLIWRFARPLRRTIFEVSATLVGSPSGAWWRARRTGKIYFPSLADLVREKHQGKG